MTSRILRFPEVQTRIGGYCRVHVDRLEKAGQFPKRIQIGSNAVGWDEAEIEAWIKSRKDARHHPEPAAVPPSPPRKRGRPPISATRPAL